MTAYIRTRTLEEVLLMVKEKQGAAAARVRAQVRTGLGVRFLGSVLEERARRQRACAGVLL